MGKTRVFSWKIKDNVYGYLYTGKNDGSLISERIMEPTLLNEIADVVSEMTEEEYSSAFTELNGQISSRYGVSIPGSYSDYYGSDTGNYIVLTGKDGSSFINNSYGKVDEESMNKIKEYIDNKLNIAKEQLKDDVNFVNAQTIDKIEHINANVSAVVNAAEQALEANNAVMANKLESAASAIQTATKIFDLESNGVTAEKLKTAIDNYDETKTWINSKNADLESNKAQINSIIPRLDETHTMVEQVDVKVDSYKINVDSKLSELENNVKAIDNKVNTIKASSSVVQDSDSNVNDTIYSRGIAVENDYDSIYETETIDNEDGTFDVKTTIGNETFEMRVLGFGNKLGNDEKHVGFSIANNGFKYLDKSGSFISIIDGDIILSNASGSGKIEIKSDGVHITGRKRKQASEE